MVICVCHNVNERAIAEQARQGVRSIKQLSTQTRAGTRCGKCLCEARRVLVEAVEKQDQALVSAQVCGTPATFAYSAVS